MRCQLSSHLLDYLASLSPLRSPLYPLAGCAPPSSPTDPAWTSSCQDQARLSVRRLFTCSRTVTIKSFTWMWMCLDKINLFLLLHFLFQAEIVISVDAQSDLI